MKTSVTVPVIGMHCASCANIIERALSKLSGVESVRASYATEKAIITYDSRLVTPVKLHDAVRAYGYQLVFPTDSPETTSQDDALLSQKRIATTALGIALVMFFYMMWDLGSRFTTLIPANPISTKALLPLEFIVASIMFWGFGRQFIYGVIRFIKTGSANMDTLVGLGTGAAYLYSSCILLFPTVKEKFGLSETTVYFDATIVVTGFILFGKYLEAQSKQKTKEALGKLMGLAAKTAIVRRGDQEVEVPIEEVVVGDRVIVKPGTTVPVDGTVCEGSSTINESMVTGESMPVDVAVGASVVGGTMNLNGAIVVEATKVGKDTLLARITKRVEEAQSSKAPIERLADAVSSRFVPIVLVIAFVSSVTWILIGSVIFTPNQTIAYAISSLIGVLVIACPCALGLATPTAMIVAVGRGAAHGILIKDAESLERLHTVSAIVMDKTGTLTKGKPEVTDIKIKYQISLPRRQAGNIKYSNQISNRNILQILASLEQYSEHPIAHAILEKAKEEKITLDSVDDFKVVQGMGVEGVIKGVKYKAGNAAFMKQSQVVIDQEPIEKETQQGKTPIFLASGQEIMGIVFVADTLKEHVAKTISSIKHMGIDVIMLSGDNTKTAEFVARQAGIDRVIAGVLPLEKAQHIEEIKQHNKGVVMIGDGINDAPALAIADVGIALSTGTDIAMSTANITLLHGDLQKVLTAIRLSKKTMTVIKQNLFWAFAYNVIGIPIAAGALYPFIGVLLPPAFAGLAMAASSVSVVTNSLRLKTIKI